MRTEWVRVPPLALGFRCGSRVEHPAGTVRVHDVVWQPATLPWWMRGFKSPWTLCFRMWESLGIRQLGVLESVGSNPTILTELLSRSTTVVRPAVNGKVVGSSPTGTARTRTCSWESSRSPKPAEWVRILPFLLRALCPRAGSRCSLAARHPSDTRAQGRSTRPVWTHPSRYSRGPAATAPGSQPGTSQVRVLPGVLGPHTPATSARGARGFGGPSSLSAILSKKSVTNAGLPPIRSRWARH